MEGSMRLDKALTTVSVKYKNADFVAGRFLKETPVMKDSDKYWVYVSDFKIPDSERRVGSRASMKDWSASTSSYNLVGHALKGHVYDEDLDNVEKPLNLEIDTTEDLTDSILLRQEYDAQKLLFTTTTWSNNATIATATSWTYNTTTSAPIQNVLSATGAILKASGMRPNKAVCGWEVLEALKENNNVYSRIQYVERALITEGILASLFDIDELVVGTSHYNSNKKGEAESNNFIWGDDFLLGYVNPSQGLRKVTCATTFRSTKRGNPFRVKTYRDESLEAKAIEVQTKYQHKAVATGCAYLFKAVTTA